METLPELSNKERLVAELDFRLAEVWEKIYESEGFTLASVAALIRMAYGKGYQDALQEEEPAALLKVVPGYKIRNRRR